MRLFKFLFILFLLTSIVGCGFLSRKPDTVVVNKVVLLEIPEEFTQKCTVAKPFDRAIYLKAPDKDREEILVKLNIDQYAYSEACNTQLSKLREWYKQQSQLRK